MAFKVEIWLKINNEVKHIIIDDVYIINTYIDCIEFYRVFADDAPFQYKYDKIKKIKIKSIEV